MYIHWHRSKHFFCKFRSILLKGNNDTNRSTKKHIHLADKKNQRKNTSLPKGERQNGAVKMILPFKGNIDPYIIELNIVSQKYQDEIKK